MRFKDFRKEFYKTLPFWYKPIYWIKRLFWDLVFNIKYGKVK